VKYNVAYSNVFYILENRRILAHFIMDMNVTYGKTILVSFSRSVLRWPCTTATTRSERCDGFRQIRV